MGIEPTVLWERREERSEFIRAKYVEKKFAIRQSSDLRDLHSDVEHAIKNKDIHQLLQAYVDGADFSQPLIDSVRLRNRLTFHHRTLFFCCC